MLYFISNYLYILLSIFLFFVPFVAHYLYVHKLSIKNQKINLLLENFFGSKESNWLVFFWAFGEAIVWFVIPEFLLLLVIFMRVHKKRELLKYDIAGTIAGTIAALLIRMPRSLLNQLPYIQERMLDQTQYWYHQSDIFALIHQPFSGVPYKVFTNLAWQESFFLPSFVLFAVIVRMFRYIFAYGLFISLYPRLHRIVKRNYIVLALCAILIFTYLLLKTVRIYG